MMPKLGMRLKQLLDEGQLLVVDGGLATEVEAQGGDITGSLWSAKALVRQPDLIRATHEAYFKAGANICITSTYQLSKQNLYDFDPSVSFTDLVQRSVWLAQRARAKCLEACSTSWPMFVAGSVGPYGASLANGSEYTGEYGDCTVENLYDFHVERIQTLCESGADLLAIETIPSKMEVMALTRVLQEPSFIKTPSWISFTLQDSTHISDGTSLQEVYKLVENVESVFAVGVNCVHPGLLPQALQELRKICSKHILVYPNSGETWDAKQRRWRGTSMSEAGSLSERVKEWIEAGAVMIGGCCRTGPRETQTVRKCIDVAGQSTG